MQPSSRSDDECVWSRRRAEGLGGVQQATRHGRKQGCTASMLALLLSTTCTCCTSIKACAVLDDELISRAGLSLRGWFDETVLLG